MGASVAAWMVGSVLVDAAALAVSSGLWAAPLVDALVVPLLSGAAVFLGLWLVAPIAGELDLRHVLTRALLVLGMTATVWWIAEVIVALGRTWLACVAPDVVGVQDAGCFAAGFWISELVPGTLGHHLVRALGFAILTAPAVLLGSVLLWMRRRARPLAAEVAGLIDV